MAHPHPSGPELGTHWLELPSESQSRAEGGRAQDYLHRDVPRACFLPREQGNYRSLSLLMRLPELIVPPPFPLSFPVLSSYLYDTRKASRDTINLLSSLVLQEMLKTHSPRF